MKKIMALLLLVFTLVGLGATAEIQAATPKLNKAKAVLEVDATLTLKLKEASGTTTWKSSDKKIATVSKKGKVTAISEGTTTITATNKGSKYTCTVTVVDSNKDPVNRIVDNSSLLTSKTQKTLKDKLNKLSEKYNLDVVIVSSTETPNEYVTAFGDNAVQYYADDLYDYGGYSKDGILLLICNESREYAISTKGKGISLFNDFALSEIVNDMFPYLKDSDWDGAYLSFANSVSDILSIK